MRFRLEWECPGEAMPRSAVSRRRVRKASAPGRITTMQDGAISPTRAGSGWVAHTNSGKACRRGVEKRYQKCMVLRGPTLCALPYSLQHDRCSDRAEFISQDPKSRLPRPSPRRKQASCGGCWQSPYRRDPSIARASRTDATARNAPHPRSRHKSGPSHLLNRRG